MMHSTGSITNDILNLIQNIENKAVFQLQQACSDIVLNLNLRDNFGRPISSSKLNKLISDNKKITTFLFDDISKQAIAIFTIITQGTPRVVYTNLTVSKKYYYQTHMVQNILAEEFGYFEDDNQPSSILVQISMNESRRSNPQLALKNLGYTSAVTLSVLSINAISTIFDSTFVKWVAGYIFFFPVYPFILFFAPWPILFVFPVSTYLFMVIYKTLNQLVENEDD
jgi:hypothetical protein